MLYASVERGVDLVAIRYPETNRDTANGQYGFLFHPSHPEGGMLVGRCKDRPHVQHDQRCAVSYSFNFLSNEATPSAIGENPSWFLGHLPLSPHRLLMACWSRLGITVSSLAREGTIVVETREHTIQ